jgi:hypothetical protein
LQSLRWRDDDERNCRKAGASVLPASRREGRPFRKKQTLPSRSRGRLLRVVSLTDEVRIVPRIFYMPGCVRERVRNPTRAMTV